MLLRPRKRGDGELSCQPGRSTAMIATLVRKSTRLSPSLSPTALPSTRTRALQGRAAVHDQHVGGPVARVEEPARVAQVQVDAPAAAKQERTSARRRPGVRSSGQDNLLAPIGHGRDRRSGLAVVGVRGHGADIAPRAHDVGPKGGARGELLFPGQRPPGSRFSARAASRDARTMLSAGCAVGRGGGAFGRRCAKSGDQVRPDGRPPTAHSARPPAAGRRDALRLAPRSVEARRPRRRTRAAPRRPRGRPDRHRRRWPGARPRRAAADGDGARQDRVERSGSGPTIAVGLRAVLRRPRVEQVAKVEAPTPRRRPRRRPARATATGAPPRPPRIAARVTLQVAPPVARIRPRSAAERDRLDLDGRLGRAGRGRHRGAAGVREPASLHLESRRPGRLGLVLDVLVADPARLARERAPGPGPFERGQSPSTTRARQSRGESSPAPDAQEVGRSDGHGRRPTRSRGRRSAPAATATPTATTRRRDGGSAEAASTASLADQPFARRSESRDGVLACESIDAQVAEAKRACKFGPSTSDESLAALAAPPAPAASPPAAPPSDAPTPPSRTSTPQSRAAKTPFARLRRSLGGAPALLSIPPRAASSPVATPPTPPRRDGGRRRRASSARRSGSAASASSARAARPTGRGRRG